MKKIWKRVLSTMLTVSLIASFNVPKITFAQKTSNDGIVINKENFPDENFLSYITTSNFDTNKDGKLSNEELENVRYIYVNMKGIKSLQGIEYFKDLKYLYAEMNYIESLDLSQNKNLVVIYCGNNKLTSIKLPNQNENYTLEYLDVFANELTTLDLHNLKGLTFLSASDNFITNLDLSDNPLSAGNGFIANYNFIEKITLPNNGASYPWKEFLKEQTYPKDKSVGYKVQWYLDEGKSMILDPNTETIKCEGQTLYAEYVPITYTVQFNSNNGMAEAKTQKFEYGTAQKLLKNEFTKKDYYFAGWKDEKGRIYNDESEVINLTDVDGKVLNLTAVWKEVDYTGQEYTINLHDGENLVTVKGEYGNSVELPKNESTKVGYDFMGWNFGSGDYGIFSNGGKVLMTHPDDLNGENNTLNLYSVWKKQEFTVNFIDTQNSYKKTVQYNDNIEFPVDPTKEGYIFEGWVTESGEKWDEQRSVTSNLNLYADYSPIKYSVSFDGNGADNEDVMSSIKIEMDYSKQATLPTNMYEKASYTLEGWSTSQNGAVEFADEDVIYQLTTEENKNITLYAVWEKVKSESTIDITTSSLNKTYDGKVVSNPAVNKSGSINTVKFTWYQMLNDNWTMLESAPSNVGKYKVVASVEADENYKEASDELQFEIVKANPTYTQIGELSASYGDTLSDINLPTGFTWQEDLSTSVGNLGTNIFKLTYTPEDTINYEIIKDIEVKVNVRQAINSWISDPSIEGWKYGEGNRNPVAQAKFGEVEFTYSNSESGEFTNVVPIEVGTWYMKATVKGNQNYTGLEKVVSFVIEEKPTENNPSVEKPSEDKPSIDDDSNINTPDKEEDFTETVPSKEDKVEIEVSDLKQNEVNEIIIKDNVNNYNVELSDIEVLKSGEGSLDLTLNNVNIKLPFSVIDSNLIDENDTVTLKLNLLSSSSIIKDLKAVNKVFDFNLIINKENEGVDIHNFKEGLVEITISLSDEELKGLNRDKLKVYYYNEETNKFEVMETKVEGNNITFKTSHFSKYVVAEEIASDTIDKPNTDGNTSTNKPNEGDDTTINIPNEGDDTTINIPNKEDDIAINTPNQVEDTIIITADTEDTNTNDITNKEDNKIESGHEALPSTGAAVSNSTMLIVALAVLLIGGFMFFGKRNQHSNMK